MSRRAESQSSHVIATSTRYSSGRRAKHLQKRWQTERVSFFEPPATPPPRPEPPDLPQRRAWWGAPENELGGPVPLRLVLARTDRVVIAVLGAVAFSAGIEFTLAVRRRLAATATAEDIDQFYEGDPFHPPFGHPRMRMRRLPELPEDVLRFGVQFSTGQKATTTGGMRPWDFREEDEEEREPEGPILMEQGGSGGGGHYDQDFWLWPLPPAGPFTFVVEWPSEQIELTRQEVDAALFLDASTQSERLWPGEESSGDGSRWRLE